MPRTNFESRHDQFVRYKFIRTQTGRIVYDRPKHFMNSADALRLSRRVFAVPPRDMEITPAEMADAAEVLIVAATFILAGVRFSPLTDAVRSVVRFILSWLKAILSEHIEPDLSAELSATAQESSLV